MNLRLLPAVAAATLALASLGAMAAATTIYHFQPIGNQPYWPTAHLIQDGSGGGDFFTTTRAGGADGAGTLLRVSPGGLVTRMHDFTPTNLTRGTHPSAPLLQIGNHLYGTTEGGSEPAESGAGSVFRYTPATDQFKVLHTFVPNLPLEGQHPTGGLILGSDGFLWGTTIAGGSVEGWDWSGTIYKIRPDGSGYTQVHDFNGGPGDGKRPYTPLTEASPGVLYGTAQQGGALDSGVIYRVDMATSQFSVVHEFGSAGDGSRPYSGLLKAGGKLYGTTVIGGLHNHGMVYEFDAATATVIPLHHFNDSLGEGRSPRGELMQASNGRLYGVNSSGGTSGGGTVFELTPGPAPQLTVLHSFLYNDKVDGYTPETGLVEGAGNLLYGTTRYGGGRSQFRFRGTIYTVSF